MILFGEPGPHGHDEVEGHAHAGQVFAGKLAARQLWIEDAGGGQAGAGQVMVRDQHFEAKGLGCGNTCMARDPVVHGDEPVGQWREALPGVFHQGWREPVAKGKSIRHEKVHLCSELSQPPNHHGGGGGAVGIVVTHDENGGAPLDGLSEAGRRLWCAGEGVWRVQANQRSVEFIGMFDAPAGQEICKDGRHALRLQLGLEDRPLRPVLQWNGCHARAAPPRPVASGMARWWGRSERLGRA